jgi:hypothetical protein
LAAGTYLVPQLNAILRSSIFFSASLFRRPVDSTALRIIFQMRSIVSTADAPSPLVQLAQLGSGTFVPFPPAHTPLAELAPPAKSTLKMLIARDWDTIARTIDVQCGTKMFERTMELTYYKM